MVNAKKFSASFAIVHNSREILHSHLYVQIEINDMTMPVSCYLSL